MKLPLIKNLRSQIIFDKINFLLEIYTKGILKFDKIYHLSFFYVFKNLCGYYTPWGTKNEIQEIGSRIESSEKAKNRKNLESLLKKEQANFKKKLARPSFLLKGNTKILKIAMDVYFDFFPFLVNEAKRDLNWKLQKIFQIHPSIIYIDLGKKRMLNLKAVYERKFKIANKAYPIFFNFQFPSSRLDFETRICYFKHLKNIKKFHQKADSNFRMEEFHKITSLENYITQMITPNLKNALSTLPPTGNESHEK